VANDPITGISTDQTQEVIDYLGRNAPLSFTGQTPLPVGVAHPAPSVAPAGPGGIGEKPPGEMPKPDPLTLGTDSVGEGGGVGGESPGPSGGQIAFSEGGRAFGPDSPLNSLGVRGGLQGLQFANMLAGMFGMGIPGLNMVTMPLGFARLVESLLTGAQNQFGLFTQDPNNLPNENLPLTLAQVMQAFTPTSPDPGADPGGLGIGGPGTDVGASPGGVTGTTGGGSPGPGGTAGPGPSGDTGGAPGGTGAEGGTEGDAGDSGGPGAF
jgi:hypothetical protein